MITVKVAQMQAEIAADIARFQNLIKASDTKKGIAGALYQGGKQIAQAARQLAPKAGRKKKGSQRTSGKTGLLRRSYTTKKGVSKKGAGEPFAVVGPSRTIAENVIRGRHTVSVKPSNYAHLVEFGFNAHHRVPLVKGRNHERLAKKGVLWQPSTLEKYMKLKNLEMQKLSKGKKIRAQAFMGSSGQGTSRVPPQHILQRAYQQTIGAATKTIMESLGVEMDKVILRAQAKLARKVNPHASGNRGPR